MKSVICASLLASAAAFAPSQVVSNNRFGRFVEGYTTIA